MAAATAPSTPRSPIPNELKFAAENLVDEYSSAWLYRELAKLSKSDKRRELLEQFARFEDGHAETWALVLDRRGVARPPLKKMRSHKVWVRLAKMFGVSTVLPLIHRHEVDAVGKYLEQEKLATEPDIKAAFASIIPDEVSHEIEILESIQAEDANPGSLRSIVLGATDGLGSILALVAGVAGAVASSSIVLIAGVAGLVAGSVSMALSNYISVKSEREGRDARVAVQRVGIERAAPAKLKQLEHLLQTRGLSTDEARPVAARLSNNPEEFLKAILREGYGLGDASFEQPGRLAAYTGFAFLIAGAIPIIPFFFFGPTEGLIAALVMSVLALFLAGVLKTLITLGKMLKSGVEMMAIGLGSAGATYVVGSLIGQYGL